jgi:hypothetical protein
MTTTAQPTSSREIDPQRSDLCNGISQQAPFSTIVAQRHPPNSHASSITNTKPTLGAQRGAPAPPSFRKSAAYRRIVRFAYSTPRHHAPAPRAAVKVSLRCCATLTPLVTVARLTCRLRGKCLSSHQGKRPKQSRPFTRSTPVQHRAQLCRQTIHRIHAPLKFPRDYCLRLRARKRLKHTHLFLRPRTTPRYLLAHRCSPCRSVATESAPIVIHSPQPAEPTSASSPMASAPWRPRVIIPRSSLKPNETISVRFGKEHRVPSSEVRLSKCEPSETPRKIAAEIQYLATRQIGRSQPTPARGGGHAPLSRAVLIAEVRLD